MSEISRDGLKHYLDIIQFNWDIYYRIKDESYIGRHRWTGVKHSVFNNFHTMVVREYCKND
jgi:hypothetical protein